MFPTLQQLTLNTLIKFKQHLGDVGAAPVDLLDGVLSHCTAEELAEVEDGTREGSGRELSPWLWPYWRHLVVERFGEPPAGERLPQLPAAADVAFVPGQRPADFRALYSQRVAELERKKVESGARLRALREQEEQAKQARHVMVVDPLPRNRRQRSANGGAGGSGQRNLFQSPGQPSTKDRLLRKLGIGKGAGAGGGGSSFVGSRGGAGQKTIIRPAGRPGAAAGAVRAPSSGTIRQPYGAVPQRLSPKPPVGGRLAGVQSPATLSPAAVNSSGALPTPLLARHQQQQQQQRQQMPAALSNRLPHKQARSPASHDSLFIPKEHMVMAPTVLARQPSPAPPVPLSAAVRAKQQLQQHQQAQQAKQQKQADQQKQQAEQRQLAQQQRQQAQRKGEQAQKQQAQQRQLAQQKKQGQQAGRAGAMPASTPPPDQRQLAAVPAPCRQLASPQLVLEECDIFADAEQEQQQQQQEQPPQRQEKQRHEQQKAGLKRATASGSGSGAALPPEHKRQRQQQGQQQGKQQGQKPRSAQLSPAVGPLQEVDLFDGL